MAEPFASLQAALSDRYTIERELGHGRMATVFLARDLKHQRKVAVKVLRPEVAEALGAERFLREIEIAARLTHPHILGLHDSGEATGFLYYVMPYVEGESLRDRLSRERQLPVDEALHIATQVASALSYAHGHHVVHRDIKPENILLAGDDVTVADFGIARAITAAGGEQLTSAGIAIGTPAYMSPEQGAGEPHLDGRSDVFSLACVLYEMLTGVPPFTGPTAQAIQARRLVDPVPPLRTVRETVPPNVADATYQALAKLPADRFESAAAFARALADRSFATATRGVAAGRTWRALHPAVLTGLGLVALALAALGGWRLRGRPAGGGAPVRFYLSSDSARQIVDEFGISPDGTRLVYLARTGTVYMLFQQRLADLDPQPIPGTAGAVGSVFFSPDGTWIGFATEGALRKVRLDGSDPVTVTTLDESLAGATWGSDGSIFYSASGRLYRVGAQGGNPIPIAAQAAIGKPFVTSPLLLPGGTALLCVDYQEGGASRIGVIDLKSGEFKSVMNGLSPHYLAPGYLIYGTLDGSLMIQPFNLNGLDTTGPARRLLQHVELVLGVGIRYDVSAGGSLVYLPRARGAAVLQLLRRDGAAQVLSTGSRFWVPHFSSDGRHLAYGAYTERADLADLWIYDLATNTAQRLTSGGQTGRDYNDPVWSPDGKQIALSALDSSTAASKHLYVMPSDGSAPPTRLLTRPGFQFPSDWTRDGKSLLFTDLPPNGKLAIWRVPVSGGGSPQPVVMSAYNATGGRLSPEGRWLAFSSDETGQDEVYVQPFPGPGPKVRVSSGGGLMPAWSRSGRELFYWERAVLMAVDVRLGAQLVLGAHRTLFHANLEPNPELAQYDPHPDGQRFAIATVPGSSSRLAVMTNVLAGVER